MNTPIFPKLRATLLRRALHLHQTGVWTVPAAKVARIEQLMAASNLPIAAMAPSGGVVIDEHGGSFYDVMAIARSKATTHERNHAEL